MKERLAMSKNITKNLDSSSCYAFLISGKPFLVTIDRSEMERRYQLSVVDDANVTTDIGPPLRQKKFEDTYGFKAEWPHEVVGEVSDAVKVRCT